MIAAIAIHHLPAAQSSSKKKTSEIDDIFQSAPKPVCTQHRLAPLFAHRIKLTLKLSCGTDFPRSKAPRLPQCLLPNTRRTATTTLPTRGAPRRVRSVLGAGIASVFCAERTVVDGVRVFTEAELGLERNLTGGGLMLLRVTSARRLLCRHCAVPL